MATFLAGAVILAATHEELVDDWDTYTPTWSTSGTQPAIGNGTITGMYKRIGRFIHFKAGILAGTTTTFGTGQWNIGLPVAAIQPGSPLNTYYMDVCHIFDATGSTYIGATLLASGTAVAGHIITTAAGVAGGVTATTPFTWATSDRIVVAGTYRTAA